MDSWFVVDIPFRSAERKTKGTPTFCLLVFAGAEREAEKQLISSFGFSTLDIVPDAPFDPIE